MSSRHRARWGLMPAACTAVLLTSTATPGVVQAQLPPEAWRSPAASVVASAGSVNVSGEVASPDTTRNDAFEFGYFELMVERLRDRASLVTLVDDAGEVLIPLGAVLGHVGIPMRADGALLVLEWPPDEWRSVLDLEARSVTSQADTATYPPEGWVMQDGELYVAPEALSRILRAEVEVRFSDLLIVVSGNRDFPKILRLAQEARRGQATTDPFVDRSDPFRDVPYPDRTGGMAAGWGLSLSEGNGTRHASYRFVAGGSILGGATEAGISGMVARGIGASPVDLFARHTRAFVGSEWIRRLELGTVYAEGTVARRVTGVTVSNAPLTAPRYFADAVIAPAVPAGWEYEVYQGEYLVGVSDGQGEGGIQAPLGYGNTPVRVRLLGPAGQEVEQDLVYVVPAARVQPGSWRYSAGGGACRDDVCDGYYFGEVNRGFDGRITAGLGTDAIHGPRGSAIRPYGRLGFAPRPDMSVEVQARPATYFRTGIQWVGGRRGTASAYYTWSGGSTPDLGTTGWTGQLNLGAPTAFLGSRWLSGRLLLRGASQNRIDGWQASLGTTRGLTHLAVDLESGLQPRTLITARAFQTLPALPLPLLDHASITGAVGFDADGLELMEFGASARTRSNTRVEARLRLRDGRDPAFTLGASVRSGLGFFQARGTHGGPVAGATVSADGGFAYGKAEGLHTEANTSVGWAGIAGHTFHDLNGDGVRGLGEPFVENAVVLVGGRRVEVGEYGRFQVWGMMPYEGVSVTIDPVSLDLGLAPGEAEFLVRPSPNMFTSRDLPIVATREVMGSVVDDEDPSRGLGGVPVEIVDLEGMVVAEARTYSDGVYYIDAVPAGAYRVRIAGVAGVRASEEARVGRRFEVPTGLGPVVTLAPVTLGRFAND